VDPHGLEFPDDYDWSRAPDKDGPMGYLKGDRPWAPWDRTPKTNRIRTRPAPTVKDDKKRTAEPRMATGSRVPVESQKQLYALIDRLHDEMESAVDRLRKEYEDTGFGDPVHPRDIERRKKHGDPLNDADALESVLQGIVEGASLAANVEARPTDERFAKAAKSISKASIHYGVTWSDKSVDTWRAAWDTAACFFPMLGELFGKLFDWLLDREPDDDEGEDDE